MIFILIALVFGQELEELQQQNAQLRVANRILHNQLIALAKVTDLTEEIRAEFNINKARLTNLSELYINEENQQIKLSLQEYILEVVQIAIEDLQAVGGVIDDITAADIQKVREELKITVQEEEDAEFIEYEAIYTELKQAIINKDTQIHELEQENAGIIGKLDGVTSELYHLQERLQREQSKIDVLSDFIEETQNDQHTRLSDLKDGLRKQNQDFSARQIDGFRMIEEEQDKLIQSLDNRLAQQFGDIQELTLRHSELASQQRALINGIQDLDQEISLRSKQLEQAESLYHAFQAESESKAKSELLGLQQSYQNLNNEIVTMQTHQFNLLQKTANCTEQNENLNSANIQLNNKIKNLQAELQEAEDRVLYEQQTRTAEERDLKDQYDNLYQEITKLQGEIDQMLADTSVQSEKYRKTELELIDCEYTQGRTRTKGDILLEKSFEEVTHETDNGFWWMQGLGQ